MAVAQSISSEIKRKEALIEPKKVQEGHYMQVVHFVKVKRSYSSSIVVEDIDTGMPFEVRGADLVKRCLSADQWAEEIKLSRTEVVNIFQTCYNVPFTVCFDKQADKKSGEMEAVFAVANANPRNRCRIGLWFAKHEGDTAFEVAQRLTKYEYLDLKFDHVRSSADNQRVYNIGININIGRPEVSP